MDKEHNSDILIYQTEDGKTKIDVRLEGETVWLTQAAMAELYQSTKQNISLHIKNILSDGELNENSVVKEYLTTASDGKKYRTFFSERADANKPNMGLTSWKGSKPRKPDVTIAKNYLSEDELKSLNRSEPGLENTK